MNKLTKKDRQILLQNIISENPFLTDRELSDRLDVSIQTIRLDRLELGIPEVRERTRTVASAYARLKSVNEGEVIGELVRLELDKYAVSYLETNEEMALQRSKVIRGHFLFAQANSLAVAIINAKGVLTGSADIRFHKIVNVGDKLEARGEVIHKEDRKYLIKVDTYHGSDLIFSGTFTMFAQDMEG